MSRRGKSVLVLCSLLGFLPTRGLLAEEIPRTPDQSTMIVAVEVPVQVLLDGQPVRGLTAADFEVLDGRRKRPITGFEIVDLGREAMPQVDTPEPQASPAESALPVASGGRRRFLFLFDLGYSVPTALAKARRAAQELVRADLHPTDLAAVATYSPADGARLLVGFTSDRRQVELAIETLGGPQLLERHPDPLQMTIADLRHFLDYEIGPKSENDLRFLEWMQDQAELKGVIDRRAAIDRAAVLSGNLADLAKLMASVGGRKIVVYLSGGFDPDLLSGTRDRAAREQMQKAIESGQIMRVDSEAMFGSTHLQNEFERMLEGFRRADCTIHAVDVAGIAAGGDAAQARVEFLGGSPAAGKETLFTMASGTGGKLYENFNDLRAAMAQMLAATSLTYVLSFQPDEIELDGRYHSLKVKLMGGPKGARLLHRPGYFAPSPFDQRLAAERQLDSAQLLIAGKPGGSIELGFAVAALPAPGERTQISVVVGVDGHSLSAGEAEAGLGLDLYLYAFDRQGGLEDYFAQSLLLDLGRVGQRLRQGGLRVLGTLDLAPGEYSLRALVRHSRSGAYGLAAASLAVPPVVGERPLVLQPLFAEPMATGLVARAAALGELPVALPFPVSLEGVLLLPEPRPWLAPQGETRVCQPVFRLGSATPTVEVRVLASDRREMSGPAVTLMGRTETGVPELDCLWVRLQGAGLAPGEYLLELTVSDPSIGGRTISTVPFQVATRGN